MAIDPLEEDLKGMVAPGKLANIAVFEAGLVGLGETDHAKPFEAKVRRTVVGGRVVYRAARR